MCKLDDYINENASDDVVMGSGSPISKAPKWTYNPAPMFAGHGDKSVMMLSQALTKAGYSSRKTMKYLADKELIGMSTSKDGTSKNSVIKWFNNRSFRFVEFHLGKLVKENDPLVDKEEVSEKTGTEWRKVSESEQMELPFD